MYKLIAHTSYWQICWDLVLFKSESASSYSYLSLKYFATFWIILNYDWFNKDLGASFTKNVAYYWYYSNFN